MEFFLCKFDLLVKYLVTDQITYLKQKYTRLLNHAVIDNLQCYSEYHNIASAFFSCGIFSSFFFPGYFLPALLSSFIVSSVKYFEDTEQF